MDIFFVEDHVTGREKKVAIFEEIEFPAIGRDRDVSPGGFPVFHDLLPGEEPGFDFHVNGPQKSKEGGQDQQSEGEERHPLAESPQDQEMKGQGGKQEG